MKKWSFIFIISMFIFLFDIPCFSEVKDENIINVAVNCHMPPFQFKDENGNCIGMHIDIMDFIANKNKLQINYVHFDKNSDCILALEDGTVDIVLGYKVDNIMHLNYEYTGELSSSHICMITSKELATVLNSKEYYDSYDAALEYDTIGYSYMTKWRLKNYVVRGNQDAVLTDLVIGDVDIAIGVKDSFEYMLDRGRISNDFFMLHNHIHPISYSMIVKKADKVLLRLLNEGLTDIRASGKYETIYNRWIINRDLEIVQERIKKIIIFTSFTIIVSAIIVLFIFSINRILKHKVQDKTKELSYANEELEKRMAQIESESRIRNEIIECSPFGIVLFDNEYHITLMNSVAQLIGGLTEKLFLYYDIRKIKVFGEILSQLDCDIFSNEEYGEKFGHPVVITLSKAHKKCNYRYNIYFTRDRDIISGALMTVEDVTREEQEKQRLFEEDKNKTLNSLIAGIAHEIKNPLMTIQTATSLIIEQGYNLEVRDAFTMFVPHEIDRINQLIEGFINYARPLRGGVVELFCISTLIKECIYLVKIMSKKDKFIIITDIEEELYIYANKDKIKQSIINLIINGIESMKLKLVNMPEAILKMSIKTYSLENDVFVKIRDQGVGMSLADIKKCTQPFFTTKTAGTGLGLAIVKQFIQENDGTLAIDSEKGKYAEFSIIFRRYYHDKE